MNSFHLHGISLENVDPKLLHLHGRIAVDVGPHPLDIRLVGLVVLGNSGILPLLGILALCQHSVSVHLATTAILWAIWVCIELRRDHQRRS